ncbi:hypothetical protein QBC35DRAFT_190298 [Podospora australis]|uniref:Uncharacterized protein n=1 Tax=Podospora australis TaxID=1536484 RepID=A0AAN6WZ28_9PEZI|nr:hypothetical protein QBC35DRAFT_190298 [Podospora australis]
MAFSHTPTRATLLWLLISLPLVAWDAGYVFLRPHSMPGGSLHWPLWVPYALYGEVDHVYGWKSWNAGDGFNGAQSSLNVIETLMYLYYALTWYQNKDASGTVRGKKAATAALVGYTAAVMTVSKTVLYWLNEYHSGFDNIGHNNWFRLFFLWVIPNAAWLIFPTVTLIWGISEEFVNALAGSSAADAKTK